MPAGAAAVVDVVLNPWPGQSVRVVRDGKPAEPRTGASLQNEAFRIALPPKVETVPGERFTLKTAVHEALRLAPR